MNIKEINLALKKYAVPNNKKVALQLINTFIPYVGLLVFIMYLGAMGVNYFLLLPLCILASGFMARLFIMFHDCTHRSFVKTSKWNSIFGNIFSLFVFTPYLSWQKEHNTHHATVGNLDKRGVGDIWTLTVEEYRQAGRFKRFIYRLLRNPIVLFGIAPAFLFIVMNRIPKPSASKKEVINYIYTNLGILAIAIGLSYLFTWKVYLLYQFTVMCIASSLGVWLFYIQHQFEEVYWEESNEWALQEAALKGSSFYQLPALLEWFTGYIGYHHIHHLNSRIPNYHLKSSYQDVKHVEGIKVITLKESFPLALLEFYDEKRKRLITYKELKLILKTA